MKKTTLLLLALLTFSCSKDESNKDAAAYVDPFIGTDDHGHTYPGATTPFGMVQLSPDTGNTDWDWCSGYHSSDSTIMGFSHTHLSGTGGADLGDILFMPANGNLLFTAGSKEFPDDGYRSRFKHSSETAEVGYYKVFLDDYETQVELTATPRTGIHRYKFTSAEPQHIIIDLTHGIGDMATGAYYNVIDSVTIEGWRRSRGWAEDHTVFFRARFNRPFSGMESVIEDTPSNENEGSGTNITLAAMYDQAIEDLEIQVAISATSLEGAAANLKAELTTFDQARKAAYDMWNKELGKIEIKGATDIDKKIFYTSLYHTMVAPTLISDADGGYPGVDKKTYNSNEPVYALFSLWDTFRAVHPLFTIIEPTRNEAFIRSMLKYYDQVGRLPVWDMNMNETNCMIGYHSIPVIVDAYMKGYRNFDTEKAMEAMVASAMQNDWNGVQYFRELGYIPSDKEENSVSKAVEIAYDDWCIAQMAKEMGKDSIYRVFNERAQYYKNHFDPKDKFFKGRNSAGIFNPNFNPTQVSVLGTGDFTEGNAWHYNFFVPQDVNTHIEMNGGDEAYVARIDEMFSTEGVVGHVSDVTGLIGQYAQGNEPSHQVAYLYAYAGQPWKTQERVAHITSEMFTAERNGICGNEDCGQMSAWYVMSAMGFYEVTPGSNIYILGTPHFGSTTINLENGKKFVIKTKGLTNKSYYIESVKYNGDNYTKSYITHDMIANGGTLTITMSETPNKEFGTKPEDRPVAAITDNVVTAEQILGRQVFEPQLNEAKRTFSGSLTLHPTAAHQIYYTADGSTPTVKSAKAGAEGIKLTKSTLLKTVAISESGKESTVTSDQFYITNMPESTKVTGTAPTEPYVSTGMGALIDGIMGGDTYKSTAWLGFSGNSPDICLEFQKPIRVNTLMINTVNKPNDWILAPASIIVRTSQFGTPVAKFQVQNRSQLPEKANMFKIPVNITTDKLFITLEGGLIPSWHVNAGNPAWIFVDEIMIN